MAEEDPFSNTVALAVSLACTVVAILISSWHITMHLRNYTEPTYQRYIVRIIFMVPVYATMSFGALAYNQYAMYFNTIRDVYEAWVIYNFLSLCLSWVGGPGAVVTTLSGRLLKPSWLLMTCCFPPIPLDGRFIRRCKQGCLQFVFLKPLLAATCLILYSKGLYADGDFSLENSYIYITCVYMTSYTVAIYSLILFYVACKDLLHSFNPIPKFLMIKAVVFLTYWQGVLIFTVGEMGWVKGGKDDAADLQNVLICVEMALGALGFMYAFPYKPFMHASSGSNATAMSSDASAEHTMLTNSLKHAIDFHDVVDDTVHQFAATYHDYVLYSDGTEDTPTNFRTRKANEMLSSVAENGSSSELSTAISMKSTAEPQGGDNISSRSSSLISDPSATAAETVALKAEHSAEGAEGGHPQHASSVSVGASSILVRLPPPPEGARNKAGSQGFDLPSSADGNRNRPRSEGFDLVSASNRSSGTTEGGSGASSHRSSATEMQALKKDRGQGGDNHHLNLLMDEDELDKGDPSKDDLEGFIQR